MFSRKERARLFRKWPGSSSMWMKGGDRIWGTRNYAPDDPENATDTHGRFFSFRQERDRKSQVDSTSSSWAGWVSGSLGKKPEATATGRSTDGDEIDEKDKTTSSPPNDSELNSETVRPNLTMNEAGAYVLAHTPNVFQRMLEANYSNGFETDPKVLKENGKDHRKVSLDRCYAEAGDVDYCRLSQVGQPA
jgi:phospholipid:diacylglycerol acyltransferase